MTHAFLTGFSHGFGIGLGVGAGVAIAIAAGAAAVVRLYRTFLIGPGS